jgi:hypothetical protein
MLLALALAAAAALAPATRLAAQAPSPLPRGPEGRTGEPGLPPPLPAEVFAGQKPVTEADLDLAVDLIRSGRDGKASASDMEAMAKRHRVDDPFRAAYVASRFGAGILMLRRGATAADIETLYGTPLAVPSEAELRTVRELLPKVESRLGLK